MNDFCPYYSVLLETANRQNTDAWPQRPVYITGRGSFSSHSEFQVATVLFPSICSCYLVCNGETKGTEKIHDRLL